MKCLESKVVLHGYANGSHLCMWQIVTHVRSHLSECRSCQDHAMPLAAWSATPSPQLLLSSPVALTCRQAPSDSVALLGRLAALNIIESQFFSKFTMTLICLSVLATLALWQSLTWHVSVIVPRPCLSLSRQCLKWDETGWNMIDKRW